LIERILPEGRLLQQDGKSAIHLAGWFVQGKKQDLLTTKQV
jgi:hypothetical protein